MKNRIFLLMLLCGFLSISSNKIQAQSLEEMKLDNSCRIIEEQIIPLKAPEFGVSAQWKKTISYQSADVFADLKPLADGGVVIAGLSYPLPAASPQDKEKFLKSEIPNEMVLVRYDAAGKLIWEKREKIASLVKVNSVTVVQNRIFVLSTLDGKNGKSLRLDFFDGAGAIKISKTLSDPDYELTGVDSISISFAKNDAPVLMLAILATSKKNKQDQVTKVIVINSKGEKIRQREYLPGVANRPHSLTRMKDGSVLVSGRVRIQDNRDAGWLLHLDRTGNVISQQSFARGAQSLLRKSISLPNGDWIAIGDSLPILKSNPDAKIEGRAAWVMRLKSDMSIVWQHYYTGSNVYKANDVSTDSMGRILILLSGGDSSTNDQIGQRPHARILTLNQSGQILSDQSMREGSQLEANRLLINQEAPFIAGVAQTGMAENSEIKSEQKMEDIYKTFDLYVSKLSPIGSGLSDPCAKYYLNDKTSPEDLDLKQ